tara:strand:- start:944 stop:1252 length:309 start_codon:yes stop_codon:yes gene_type:complete
MVRPAKRKTVDKYFVQTSRGAIRVSDYFSTKKQASSFKKLLIKVGKSSPHGRTTPIKIGTRKNVPTNYGGKNNEWSKHYSSSAKASNDLRNQLGSFGKKRRK